YSVKSIPATFLLDRDGRVALRQARGPALDTAVQALIDRAPSVQLKDEFPLGEVVLGCLGLVGGTFAGAVLQRRLTRPLKRPRPPPPPGGQGPCPPSSATPPRSSASPPPGNNRSAAPTSATPGSSPTAPSC